MILTTSPTIEGVPIKTYLRPVSSHVVLGTNIFSDFSAGLRDVFGGRSQSYQKQLKRLTDTVLYELELEAKALKADAVVGIDIDFSEMSGGGKAGMLMAIATGTAVILTKSQEVSGLQIGRIIDNEELVKQLEKSKRISAFREKNESSDLASDIGGLIDTGAHEIWEEVFERLQSENTDWLRSTVTKYVIMCCHNKGYKWTLEAALSHDLALVRSACLSELAQNENFQLGDLIPFVGKINVLIADNLLRAATFQQEIYSERDLKHCLDLHDAIESAYPLKAKKTISKGMMGKETEVWICECGGKMNDSVCRKCIKDPWGFKQPKTSVGKALRTLEETAEALKAIFAST